MSATRNPQNPTQSTAEDRAVRDRARALGLDKPKTNETASELKEPVTDGPGSNDTKAANSEAGTVGKVVKQGIAS